MTLNNEAIADMDPDLWTTPGKNPDGSPNKFRAGYLACRTTGTRSGSGT